VRVLLMDRGFLDGRDLWVLKAELGIDFVVPSKDKMRVTEDARGLCRQGADGQTLFQGERAGKKKVDKAGKVEWEGQVSVVGVAGLASYDQYGDEEHARGANRKDFEGNALGAVVVTKWQGQEYKVGDEKVFLSSLPIESPLEVLDLYDLRSLIENTASRELKQGWNLKSYPKEDGGGGEGARLSHAADLHPGQRLPLVPRPGASQAWHQAAASRAGGRQRRRLRRRILRHLPYRGGLHPAGGRPHRPVAGQSR